jgi:molecular chaperone GrpE
VTGGNGRHEDDEPEAKAAEGGMAPVDGETVAPASSEEVAGLRREIDDLKDQLLRRRADFENFRKRVERDRQVAALEAEVGLLKALVPALDNLDRALEAARGDDPLREGVELIRRELLAALEARGVVVDDPVGQPFDPEKHQALAHEPSATAAEGTVLEVLRKGFLLRDRLIRPALVKVAKGSDGQGPEAVH